MLIGLCNQGHHFIQNVYRNMAHMDRPLKIYICTRSAPPEGELARFAKSQHSLRIKERTEALHAQPVPADVSVHHLPLDLLDPNSIRNCASEFLSRESRLDTLVLNAAIAPNKRQPSGFIIPGQSTEGSGGTMAGDIDLDTGMMTNVIGSAILTKLLEPALLKAPEFSEDVVEKPRIVLVSSELHRRLGDLEGLFELFVPSSEFTFIRQVYFILIIVVTPQSIQKLASSAGWKGMQTYKLTKLIQ